MTNEIIIPPAVENDPSARELARGWIVNRRLSLTLRDDAWPDIGMWGIAFADIARHVADGLHKIDGISVNESLHQIGKTFFEALEKKK